MLAIFPIGVPKSPLQLRFFDERNVNEIENQKTACPDAMGQRQQHARLPEKEQNHSGDHRIADELIRPARDENTWRIPWRESPLPFRRKPLRGSHSKDKSHDEQGEAEHLK